MSEPKNIHLTVSIVTLITMLTVSFYAATYKANVDRDISELQSQVMSLFERVEDNEMNTREIVITLTRIDESTKNIQKTLENLVKKNN